MTRLRDERGISLVWLAMTLLLLIGMAGFATDLGWLYLNTTRAQKGVDAAALAGVVNLPGFIAQAGTDAENAARANGYDPGGADHLEVTPLADNTLHAELTTHVPTFFLQALGFDQFTVTREATAQYVKPVPLGNPNNCFGCPSVGSSWAAVSSRFVSKEYGDPYSTQCLVASGPSSCSSTNTEFNRGGAYNGYYYGVEVKSGSSGLDVAIYDAAFDERPNLDVETGDWTFTSSGPTTNYTLNMVDATPLDPTDNPVIGGCSWSLPPNAGAPYKNQWVTLCSLSGSLTPGIYVLHVWTSGQEQSSNHYSVRATTNSGPQPRVFGINDMSIWSNTLVSNSELYLAEIDPVHAGKKLELQFFDPGDAGPNSHMTVLNPFGAVAPNCTWEVWNNNLTTRINTGSGCTWNTSNQVYNGLWIVALIDLPDDPADMCSGANCFWKMDLDLNDPQERTTWRARVIGNPVRLIPNA